MENFHDREVMIRDPDPVFSWIWIRSRKIMDPDPVCPEVIYGLQHPAYRVIYWPGHQKYP